MVLLCIAERWTFTPLAYFYGSLCFLSCGISIVFGDGQTADRGTAMKVIIVGAGIAGLAIGWRLAQAGAEVEIFDRGLVGRGATWAAAGMIAPGAELKDESEELAAFARRSRAAWPNFAARARGRERMHDRIQRARLADCGARRRARARACAARKRTRHFGAASGWRQQESCASASRCVSPELRGRALYSGRCAGRQSTDRRSAAHRARAPQRRHPREHRSSRTADHRPSRARHRAARRPRSEAMRSSWHRARG